MLAGSMGMLPSASLSERGPGLYEPIHGSAPDIAGKGVANPIGAVLSAALMLRYSFHLTEEANQVEESVIEAINAGILTADWGGTASTAQVMGRIIQNIEKTILPL